MKIMIPMEVLRTKSHGRDGIEVWGLVGDYEVMVWLPHDHMHRAVLLPDETPPARPEIKKYNRRNRVKRPARESQ